jgi:hypothetical protein
MFDEKDSHYTFIEKYGEQFSKEIGVPNIADMLSSHGDKAYGYRDAWKKARIPFAKGVMIFLLSYIDPYSSSVRDTVEGWVDIDEWVIKMYESPSGIREALDNLPSYFTE